MMRSNNPSNRSYILFIHLGAIPFPLCYRVKWTEKFPVLRSAPSIEWVSTVASYVIRYSVDPTLSYRSSNGSKQGLLVKPDETVQW